MAIRPWPVVNGADSTLSTKLTTTQPKPQKVKIMKYCAVTTIGIMLALGSILGPGATEAHASEVTSLEPQSLFCKILPLCR